MKYTILINQQAIATAGFHKKTDLVDWAILEYIQCWQTNPKAHRKDLKVWVNYAHLIDQMPLLGINAKGPISKRITKLRNLGLIDTEQDKDDQRIYIQTTDLYNNIVIFQTVSQEKHQLPAGNTPLPEGNTPVSQKKQTVSHEEHSYNNQIQQSEIQQSEIKEAAIAPTQKPEKQKYSAEEVKGVFDYWQVIMRSGRSILTDDRIKIIKKAFGLGYSYDDLKSAIHGCSLTPFYMGDNDQGTKYNGIELIFKNAGNIEKFIECSINPPKPSQQKTYQQKSAPSKWEMPKEWGDANAIDSTSTAVNQYYLQGN